MGTLDIPLGVSCDGLASHPGGSSNSSSTLLRAGHVGRFPLVRTGRPDLLVRKRNLSI